MRLPPFRVLKNWCRKGLVEPPKASNHAQNGISRRATIGMLLGSLTASQMHAYGAKAAGFAWFPVNNARLVPTLYASPAYKAASMSSTAPSQIDATVAPLSADGIGLQGDGSFPEDAIAGIDVFEDVWIDPGDIIDLLAFSNAPDLSGVKEVRAQFAGGNIVSFRPNQFAMGIHKVPGYQVKVADAGVGLIGPLSVMVIPYQGYAKVCTKRIMVNSSGVLARPQFWISPAGSDTGGAGTAASPWKTINKAMASFTTGSLCWMADGTYDVFEGAVPANKHNNLMHTFRAVNKGNVYLDTSLAEGAIDPTTKLPKSLTWNVTSLEFDGATLVTGRMGSLRVYGGNPNFAGKLHLKNYAITTDQSTARTRIGVNGPVYDALTGITDPDEVASPGSGGFGGSCFEGSLDGFFFTADGSQYGFTDGTVSGKGLLSDCFRRNMQGVFGFDANKVGGYSGKEFYPDGSPKNTFDDLCFLNVSQNLISATAYKGRAHDFNVVQVLSVDQTWSGAIAVKAAGGAGNAVYSNNVGAALVTIGAPAGAPTDPYFRLRLAVAASGATSVDDVTTFLTGAFKGTQYGNSYMTGTPVTGYGTTYYGMRTVALGPQTVNVNGADVVMSSGKATTVINGNAYTTGPTQLLIGVQNPGSIAVGDFVVLWNALHTDTVQYAGAGATGATPNRKNHIWLNVKSWGPGAGNLFLFQFASGQVNSMFSFDASGNWQLMNVQTAVQVASTGNVTLSAPPTTIDGYTLQTNDRIWLKNQTVGSQNGVYVYQGAGQALVRASDTLAPYYVWPILNGVQGRYGATGTVDSLIGQVVQITNTSAITVDSTSVSAVAFRVMQHDMLCVQDTTSASVSMSTYVQTVARDGLSGTTSRQFIDRSTKAAVNLGTILTGRQKCVQGLAVINMANSGANLGQIGSTGRNLGFWGGSFDSGATASTFTIRCNTFINGFQAVVLVDVFASRGFSICDAQDSKANNYRPFTDPHAWCTLVNCGAGTMDSVVSQRFGGNYADGDYTKQNPVTPSNDNVFGNGGTIDLRANPPTFAILNGFKPGRAKPQNAYDVIGAPRTAASPIGVLAA